MPTCLNFLPLLLCGNDNAAFILCFTICVPFTQAQTQYLFRSIPWSSSINTTTPSYFSRSVASDGDDAPIQVYRSLVAVVRSLVLISSQRKCACGGAYVVSTPMFCFLCSGWSFLFLFLTSVRNTGACPSTLTARSNSTSSLLAALQTPRLLLSASSLMKSNACCC